MRRFRDVLIVCLFSCAAASGTIVDRIAIRVENAIIKDSDISRSVRVTEFLNDEPLRIAASDRREAGKRLIDQAFIKREIQLGDYPQATWDEADTQLNQIKKDRYKSPAAFQQALAKYGLVEPDLRFEFQWQLTVLRFIDLRFRPAVLVTDEEIQKYYATHMAALRKENPGRTTLDDLRETIRNILSGEQVNKQFFAWLDDQRKSKKIEFHEEGLQ